MRYSISAPYLKGIDLKIRDKPYQLDNLLRKNVENLSGWTYDFDRKTLYLFLDGELQLTGAQLAKLASFGEVVRLDEPGWEVLA